MSIDIDDPHKADNPDKGINLDGGYRPYFVTDKNKMSTLADIKVFGEVEAEGESITFEEEMSLGASWKQIIYENKKTEQQFYPILNEVIDGVSGGPNYNDPFFPFSKLVGQPGDSQTFPSTPFVEELSGENKYFFTVSFPLIGTLTTTTWYLRSLTGFKNAYLKIYDGVVTDPNSPNQIWKNHTNKDILNKEGLLNAPGAAGVDITFPLGKSFVQEIALTVTYVFIADEEFSLQGEVIPIGLYLSDYYKGVNVAAVALFPYVLADGWFWRRREIFTTPVVMTADFTVEKGKRYKVDMDTAVGDVNVTIENSAEYFFIGDYDNTFNNITAVNVIIGVDTILLRNTSRKTDFLFFKEGNTYRAYDGSGELRQEGNIT